MDPEVWDDVVRATLSSWIGRHFEHCSCIDSAGIPGGRCAKHVEFLWRKRFKDDLVTQFVRSEPWLHKADRLRLRDMMVSCLEVRKSAPPQPVFWRKKHGNSCSKGWRRTPRFRVAARCCGRLACYGGFLSLPSPSCAPPRGLSSPL